MLILSKDKHYYVMYICLKEWIKEKVGANEKVGTIKRVVTIETWVKMKILSSRVAPPSGGQPKIRKTKKTSIFLILDQCLKYVSSCQHHLLST